MQRVEEAEQAPRVGGPPVHNEDSNLSIAPPIFMV